MFNFNRHHPTPTRGKAPFNEVQSSPPVPVHMFTVHMGEAPCALTPASCPPPYPLGSNSPPGGRRPSVTRHSQTLPLGMSRAFTTLTLTPTQTPSGR
eukprot:scaffold50665_cov30-Tisochrysis_lutea.AAC.1